MSSIPDMSHGRQVRPVPGYAWFALEMVLEPNASTLGRGEWLRSGFAAMKYAQLVGFMRPDRMRKAPR